MVGHVVKLSDSARAHIIQREAEESHNAYNKSANARKRDVYWIGFLDGTLSSRRIESGEEAALLAEAERFTSFFEDADAADLAEDIRARCFDAGNVLLEQIRSIIASKRSEVEEAAAYSETDEMNEFLGFCAGIICDGRVLQREAEAIAARFR